MTNEVTYYPIFEDFFMATLVPSRSITETQSCHFFCNTLFEIKWNLNIFLITRIENFQTNSKILKMKEEL